MAVMGLSTRMLVADGLYSYTMTTSTVERPSVCPLDCPDTCSLTVTVDAGRITKIRGSRANPYTAGVLCAKVPESYPEFVHGPGRLVTPLRRAGAKGEGRFERISWDEALDGPALLPSSRRDAARPPAALRRHPQRGVGGHLRRRRAGHPARADGAQQADRGVGLQRHVVGPAHDARHGSRAARRRQARGEI